MYLLHIKINKHYTLPGLALLVIVGLLIYGPIPQDPSYHQFADNRTMFGIPNFLNVITNLPFAVIGLLGLNMVNSIPEKRLKIIGTAIFIGFLLLTAGSGYYHLQPSNQSLVYDRIPISIILISMFSFIIYDLVHQQKGYWAFFILNAVGVLSVIYWTRTELVGKGDLRPYAMVQFFPLVAIPLLLGLYKSPNNYTKQIVCMFLVFGFAKLAETYDKEIYQLLGNTISGHSFKHLLMAVAGYEIAMLFRILKKRE